VRLYVCNECSEVVAVAADGVDLSNVMHVGESGEVHADATARDVPAVELGAYRAWRAHLPQARVTLGQVVVRFPAVAEGGAS